MLELGYGNKRIDWATMGIMREFVSWIYTGRLDYSKDALKHKAPEGLWLFGMEIRSPEFTNAAMRLLLAQLRSGRLSAERARFVYKNTTPGSKLRLCIADDIAACGPLRRNTASDYCTKWRQLLAQGGDIVIDNAQNGFGRLHTSRFPWCPQNKQEIFRRGIQGSREDRRKGRNRGH